MTKPRLSMIGLLLIGGAAVPWLIQRQSDIKTIDSLQTQLDQLTERRTEDENHLNRIAQAASPLPNDQLADLLKLRNEVNLLRKETNELSKLRTENRQLRSDETAARPHGQPDLAAGDQVPIASLTFAGYATPEAAFQSTLSADAKRDVRTFLEGFAPGRREEEEKQIAGAPESELAARAAELADAKASILTSTVVSDDEHVLTVFLTTDDKSATIVMKKIAGEWKISKTQH